jgi:hypothetical protein
VSEWVLLNAQWVSVRLYHDENKFHFDEIRTRIHYPEFASTSTLSYSTFYCTRGEHLIIFIFNSRCLWEITFDDTKGIIISQTLKKYGQYWFITYIYYWNLQILHNVIKWKKKYDLTFFYYKNYYSFPLGVYNFRRIMVWWQIVFLWTRQFKGQLLCCQYIFMFIIFFNIDFWIQVSGV